MTEGTYIYKKPSSDGTPLLPVGDYSFEVARCGDPYKNSKGNWVLPLRLSILPNRITVFANPWSGTDKNGERRDSIAEFLLCVGRTPKEGEEPDWGSVVGSTGQCHLKVETAKQGNLTGQEINAVAWFIVPREPNSGTKSEKLTVHKSGTVAGDDQEERDDIPF